jgi:hypothetical protein
MIHLYSNSVASEKFHKIISSLPKNEKLKMQTAGRLQNLEFSIYTYVQIAHTTHVFMYAIVWLFHINIVTCLKNFADITFSQVTYHKRAIQMKNCFQISRDSVSLSNHLFPFGSSD